ncbi:hypothetical protein GXW83_22545 [Streptacidiphilus sp. PB12-B1b]|nr:hypothetical protein GXW83_22545 [Streptacidiphilus sp. PB12-B1b]
MRVTLGLAAPALRAAMDALWQQPDLDRRYVEYLHTMHAVIRASVPLMLRAAARCAGLGPGDPLAEPLRRYFEEHAEEEQGHDDWLLADLAAAGADPAEPLLRLPPPVVAELAGAQYYWIEHHHPVTLLGYVLVLEGNAPAPWLADRLMACTGLPAAAVRTVRDHAALDSGHLRALERLLDALPLTGEQERAVTVSALHTAAALARLFHRLAAPTPSPTPNPSTTATPNPSATITGGPT